tara:strand:- start:6778 stop:9570 length:2793 start_codon:yes stop_codon:yes gene_type:complete
MADEKTVEYQQSVNRLVQERIDLLKEEKEIQGDVLTQQEEAAARRAEEKSILTDNLDLLRQDSEVLQKSVDFEIQRLETRKQLGQLSAAEIAAEEEKISNMQAVLAMTEDQKALQAEMSQDRIKGLTQAEKRLAAQQGLQEMITKSALTHVQAVTGLSPALGTASGQMANLSLKAAGFESGLEGAAGIVLGPMFSALDAINNQMKTQILAFDSLNAEVNKVTGTMNEYTQVMENVGTTSAEVGVGLEEAAEATSALHVGMTEFTELSKASQEQLIKHAATMTKLGISAETTAQHMNIMTKSLGMSQQEAKETQMEIVATAKALGQSPQQLANDFGSASSTLAAHGDDMVGVFKGLAAASKATGIEMNSLLSIAAQFDTYAGAAESAAKLNNILGGPLLNSMELMNAEEDERIRLLVQATEASGKSWAAMNKFERQSLAAAAGISDMNEAAALFSAGSAGLEEYAKKAEEAALSQKEMEEQARANQSAQEKLQKLMTSLVTLLTPIIELINDLVDYLAENDSTFKSVVFWLGGIAAGIIFMGSTISKIITSLGAFKTALTAVGGVLPGVKGAVAEAGDVLQQNVDKATKGSEQLAQSQDRMGKAGKTSGPGMLKGALGLLAMAAAVAVFAAAIWLLSDIGIGTIVAIATTLVVFAALLAVVGTKLAATGPLIAAGFAIMASSMILISAAFLVFNIGFEQFVTQILRLGEIGGAEIIAIAAGLAALGLSLIALGAGVMMFSILSGIGQLFGGGFSRLLELISTFGDAFEKVPAEAIDGLITVFGIFSDLGEAEQIAEGIGLIASAILGLAFALMFLTRESVEKFKISADAFVQYVDAGSKITEPMVENVERFVDESIRYRAAKNQGFLQGFSDEKDDFVEALKAATAAFGGATAGAATGTQGKPVVLQINERELGRTIIDLTNKSQKLTIRR